MQDVRRRGVMPEWLFDDDARPTGAGIQPHRAQVLHHRDVLAGLRGQVEQHIARRAPLFRHLGDTDLETGIHRGVADVAGAVEEALGKVIPQVDVKGRILQKLLDGFPHLVAKLVVGHRGPRVADDGDPGWEAPFISQAVKRWDQFALG